MFGRFVRDARYAALEATSVAAGLGSSSVEAEHLLIAIASGNSKAAHALKDVGLEPQELRDALVRDFERVLGTVGIDAAGVDLPANCRRTKPSWGTSAKLGARARGQGGQAQRRHQDRHRAHPPRAARRRARHRAAHPRRRGHRPRRAHGPALRIRAATPADVGAVLELWASPAPPTPSPRTRRRRSSARWARSSSPKWTGSSSAVIAAFDGWRGNFYRLAVAPARRRRGSARRSSAPARSASAHGAGLSRRWSPTRRSTPARSGPPSATRPTRRSGDTSKSSRRAPPRTTARRGAPLPRRAPPRARRP